MTFNQTNNNTGDVNNSVPDKIVDTNPFIKDLGYTEALMRNRIYETSLLFERLEGLKLIHGNGHHLAQKVAEFAVKLLREQWTGEK